jgi:hypothetical protein
MTEGDKLEQTPPSHGGDMSDLSSPIDVDGHRIDGLTLADAWMLASSTHGFATATSRSDAVRLVPLSQQLWRFRESFTGRGAAARARPKRMTMEDETMGEAKPRLAAEPPNDRTEALSLDYLGDLTVTVMDRHLTVTVMDRDDRPPKIDLTLLDASEAFLASECWPSYVQDNAIVGGLVLVALDGKPPEKPLRIDELPSGRAVRGRQSTARLAVFGRNEQIFATAMVLPDGRMITWDRDVEPEDARFRAETEHAHTFRALIEAKGFAMWAHTQWMPGTGR